MTTETEYSEVYAVYRMFGKDGTLLYVGYTSDARNRFGEHSAKRWFPLVATITLEWHSDAAEAALAEVTAIESEQPLINKAGKVKRQPQPPRPTRPAVPGTRMSRAPTAASVAGLELHRGQLLDLLAGGTSMRQAAQTLGESPWMVRLWFWQLRDEGAAQLCGAGRGSYWTLAKEAGGVV